MRLIDLDPRWVAQYGEPDGTKQGVSFLCPHCQERRLAVFFTPAIGHHDADIQQVHRDQADPGHLSDEHVGALLWQRVGETFETLTLTPSVDASHFGHWHGSITEGVIH